MFEKHCKFIYPVILWNSGGKHKSSSRCMKIMHSQKPGTNRFWSDNLKVTDMRGHPSPSMSLRSLFHYDKGYQKILKIYKYKYMCKHIQYLFTTLLNTCIVWSQSNPNKPTAFHNFALHPKNTTVPWLMQKLLYCLRPEPAGFPPRGLVSSTRSHWGRVGWLMVPAQLEYIQSGWSKTKVFWTLLSCVRISRFSENT